jgi:hypothetical protein
MQLLYRSQEPPTSTVPAGQVPGGMRLSVHFGAQITGRGCRRSRPLMELTFLRASTWCPLSGKADTMTLFVAIHQHAPERCPAGDPAMGPALLSHLSPASAGQYGVSLQAEAVANGKHTLYLIAEAGDEEQLRRYLTPFAQAGSVQVLPASPCEAVISRGGCAQVPA